MLSEMTHIYNEINMIFYVKRFLVPAIVLACAFLFASLEWFHNEWFFAAFSVVGLSIMHFWRRAIHRIEPPLCNFNRENLDDQTNRLLKKCILIMSGGLLTVDTIILFCLIVFRATISLTVCGLLLFIMFWSSIFNFGAIHIIAHNILAHALYNKDLPQNG
jgi:hypothetical protein